MRNRASSTLAVALLATSLASQAIAGSRVAVQLSGFEPGRLRIADFTLTREMPLLVHGVGAGKGRGQLYAYGWILDADDRLIWSMRDAEPTSSETDSRNLTFQARLTLRKGSYRLAFYPGNRHQEKGRPVLKDIFKPRQQRPGEWFIALLADESQLDQVGHETGHRSGDVIRLAPLRNNSLARSRFRMKNRGSVEIHALGEGYPGNELVDRSWLVELESRRVVWQATANATKAAGGARKNRESRVTLKLDAGSYELIAVTDDSHAYDEWNALPPYATDAWGVTLRAERGLLDTKSLPAEKTLARLVGAYNDEKLSATIRLDRPTLVRIYAQGEWDSSQGTLADYGWIENKKTKKVIWTMAYEGSYYAGGAGKNRAVDTSITLPPGEYVVRYVTDGSHSAQRWNSGAPFDRQNWGIIVSSFGEDSAWSVIDYQSTSRTRKDRSSRDKRRQASRRNQ